MIRELQFAYRSLLGRPGLTASAIVALGLALGASATIFGLVDGMWLRPPGVAAPSELVRIFTVTTESDDGGWSYPEVEEMQRRATSLSHVVARGQRGTEVPDATGERELVLVNVVTPNFFEALGVRATLGRLPGATDREPVVALGHAYWRSRFNGDPTIVGRTIPLGSRGQVSATVIGVLPTTFRELEPAADRDLWMPPLTWARLAGASDFEDRSFRWFGVVGRRASGQSVEHVSSELQLVVAGFGDAGTQEPRKARVISDFDHRVSNGGNNAVALLSLVIVVGLITCANLAELLLAGVARRRQEFATRVALGASQFRLVRALIAEGTLLGLAGLVVGLILAVFLMRVVPAVMVPPPGFRSFLHVSMDLRVVAFIVISALVFTVVFSLAPARLAARTDLLPLIKAGYAPVQSRFGRRLPLGLISQVALAFVLLAAASVLGRSFLRSQSGDFGLTNAPVLTAWSLTDLTPSTRAVAESRLRGLAGVSDVAVAIRAPLSLSGGGRAASVRLPGAEAIEIKYNAVSANYFQIIGTPIINGRAFSADDEQARRRVAVISRAMAALWPDDGTALGGRFQLGDDPEPWEVVGVAADAAINTIGEPIAPYIYLPFDTFGPGEVTFLLALHEDVAVPTREVRATLLDIDRALEPRRLIMMQQYVDYATGDFRSTATLAGALGALGLMMTLVGAYGVTAYRTSRRTREFGIRAALGASRGKVLAQVLRETAAIVMVGVAIGAVASLWANRVLESLLLDVRAWDPWSLAVAAVVLSTSLIAATLGPAIRAASMDPSQALRD